MNQKLLNRLSKKRNIIGHTWFNTSKKFKSQKSGMSQALIRVNMYAIYLRLIRPIIQVLKNLTQIHRFRTVTEKMYFLAISSKIVMMFLVIKKYSLLKISRCNFMSAASSKSKYILDYEWILQFLRYGKIEPRENVWTSNFFWLF